MLEQECAHVWFVIFAEGFDDILTTAIARFDIHALGEKPKNKLFVTELGNGGTVWADDQPWQGLAHSATLTLPPLGVLWLVPA